MGVLVYSPWVQNLARQRVVAMLNASPGTDIRIDSFGLRFPLTVTASGVSVVTNGDTLIKVGELAADLKLLPLLKLQADIKSVKASDALYVMGAPDSAMYMRLSAAVIDLEPGQVDLRTMKIDLSKGRLCNGCVDMTINPDTVPTPTPPAEPTTMVINARELSLDNFTFKMRMVPVIDSLGAFIASGHVADTKVDLQNQVIDVSSFTGSRLNAAYIACDSATIANTPVLADTTATTTAPWTVRVHHIDFNDSQGLYTTRGLTPLPGLDFTYIQADSMHLEVDEFYNRAEAIRLPIKLSARERCGVSINATGTFAIADSLMKFENFIVTTPTGSDLKADGYMGVGDMTTDPALPLRLITSGSLGIADLKLMFPDFNEYLGLLPAASHLKLAVDAEGNPAYLDVNNFDMTSNGIVHLQADGVLTNLFATPGPGVDLNIDGRIMQVRNIIRHILPKDMANQYDVPPMTVKGHVKMEGENYDAVLRANTLRGSLALNGLLRGNREAYRADLTLRSFPVNAFAPTLGVGRVTGRLKASGHGFDFMSARTQADVDVHIDSVAYDRAVYSGIDLKAIVDKGLATLNVDSSDPNLNLTLNADGNLTGDTYVWHADALGRYIGLYDLGFATEPDTNIKLSFDLQGSYTPKSQDIDADLRLNFVDYHMPTSSIDINDMTAKFTATDSTTVLTVNNGDSEAQFKADTGVDSLTARFSAVGEALTRQMATRSFDVEELHRLLPPFDLTFNAGTENFVNDILSDSDMSFNSLQLKASNTDRLRLISSINGFRTGTTRLDTISFVARQQTDTLLFGAHVGNRPGTLDAWKQVNLKGHMTRDNVALLLGQHDQKGKQGFKFGINATLNSDSTLTAHINPLNPMIGYHQWEVNPDNYITYIIPSKEIEANLHMTGSGSSLEIYNNKDATTGALSDLVVKVSDIHIQDWIALNPFAPSMSGDLNVDMKLRRAGGDLNAEGSVALNDFYYDRQRVGSVLAGINITTKPGGVLYADTDLSIDGVRTMTLSGNLNDMTSGSPYNLNFSMIRFPLSSVNPFLPAGVARLRGVLNGNLDIKGDADNPIINGTFEFDSTAVRLAMTGVEYAFSETKIPMVNNVLTLDDFKILAVNNNPLRINGTVDMHSLTSPLIDLSLKANEMMLINNNRAVKGADIYGKALIDLESEVKGNLDWMNVYARLRILPETNVTYIMSDASAAIESQTTGEMVRFVNFTDSAAMAHTNTAEAKSMAMNLRAKLLIDNGATINVDLSSNGTDKVSLQPVADLDFTMSPLTAERLTGRISIPQGFVRYTPPLMSEKLFNFNDNSYISFNGAMLNPTLNIYATDVVKANVTQEGQNSRLVNFDVILSVTGTFNNMNVAFDLTTRDDVTVANELESMTPQQRANQAMNLLLYNVYSGPGTKGNASLSGNPLYSFLESQLNSWAASNIKGVDISFGIDQYNRTVDGASSQTTSYSYQVSKSLFNDRFKIVVGGNYSTDANADENFSQNLINDISFEYFLNRRRSMYVRLFRHTGYESIIEGEITETGVGFVYRRKLNNLREMFRFLKRKKRKSNS